MFSLVWLVVMTLFPFSLLILRFNRGRLPRTYHAPLPVIFIALFGICPVVLGGNIALNPRTAGYFAAYTISLFVVLAVTQNKVALLRWVYWAYDQCCDGTAAGGDASVVVVGGDGHELDASRPSSRSSSVSLFQDRVGYHLTKVMTRLKRQVVCVCTKGDEVRSCFTL